MIRIHSGSVFEDLFKAAFMYEEDSGDDAGGDAGDDAGGDGDSYDDSESESDDSDESESNEEAIETAETEVVAEAPMQTDDTISSPGIFEADSWGDDSSSSSDSNDSSDLADDNAQVEVDQTPESTEAALNTSELIDSLSTTFGTGNTVEYDTSALQGAANKADEEESKSNVMGYDPDAANAFQVGFNFNDIGNAVKGAVGTLTDAAKSGYEAAKEGASKAADAAKGVFDKGVDKAGDIAKAAEVLTNPIGSLVSKAGDIKDNIAAAYDKDNSALGNIAAVGGAIGKTMADTAKDTVTGLTRGSPFEGLADKAIEGVGKLADSAKGAVRSGTDWLAEKSLDLMNDMITGISKEEREAAMAAREAAKESETMSIEPSKEEMESPAAKEESKDAPPTSLAEMLAERDAMPETSKRETTESIVADERDAMPESSKKDDDEEKSDIIEKAEDITEAIKPETKEEVTEPAKEEAVKKEETQDSNVTQQAQEQAVQAQQQSTQQVGQALQQAMQTGNKQAALQYVEQLREMARNGDAEAAAILSDLGISMSDALNSSDASTAAEQSTAAQASDLAEAQSTQANLGNGALMNGQTDQAGYQQGGLQLSPLVEDRQMDFSQALGDLAAPFGGAVGLGNAFASYMADPNSTKFDGEANNHSLNAKAGGDRGDGLTKGGRVADRNQDGKVSLWERAANMLDNAWQNAKTALGGVNRAGENAAGEKLGYSGSSLSDIAQQNGKSTLGQAMQNIGHNIATQGGRYWNDRDGDGRMSRDELLAGAASRLAGAFLSNIPVVGNLVSGFTQGLTSGKSEGLNLGAWAGSKLANANFNGNYNNANINADDYSDSSDSSDSGSSDYNEPTSNALNTNRLDSNAAARDMQALLDKHFKAPTVSSSYVSRKNKRAGEDVAYSDEQIKKYAVRLPKQMREMPLAKLHIMTIKCI